MNIKPTDLVVLENGVYILPVRFNGAIYLCHPVRPQIGSYLYNEQGKPIRTGVLYPREDEAIAKVIKRGDKMYEDMLIKYVYLRGEAV